MSEFSLVVVHPILSFWVCMRRLCDYTELVELTGGGLVINRGTLFNFKHVQDAKNTFNKVFFLILYFAPLFFSILLCLSWTFNSQANVIAPLFRLVMILSS